MPFRNVCRTFAIPVSRVFRHFKEMAEEAVISEPVSTRWFPVQRENTGKFADFGLEIAKAPRLSEENSIAWGTDKHRPASQRGIIELLNRRVERIHIGVSDNSWPNPLCANHLKKSLDQCLGCSRSLSAFVKADGIKPDRPWCHRSRISREAAKRLRPLSGRPSLGREGAVVLLPPSSKIRHHPANSIHHDTIHVHLASLTHHYGGLSRRLFFTHPLPPFFSLSFWENQGSVRPRKLHPPPGAGGKEANLFFRRGF